MNSSPQFFRPRGLALAPPPTQRACYSNRTAWLMAQMSRLAYERFEPADATFASTAERLAQTADIVPRLPPGIVIEVFVDLLRLGSWIFWFLEPVAKVLDDRVSGYRHHGDMQYLTRGKEVDYSDVRIIQNITFLARIRRLWKHRSPFGDRIRDHNIDEYCRKLAAYISARLNRK